MSTQHNKFPVVGCRAAEGRFGNWLTDLAAGEKVGGWIIVDSQRNPVAVRKQQFLNRTEEFYGEASVLFLEDVAMKGKSKEGLDRTVILPKGSLASMQLEREVAKTILATRPAMPIVATFDQVRSVLFSRMTGIELSNDDWAAYYAGRNVPRPVTMELKVIRNIVSEVLKRPEMQDQITIS